MGVDGRMAAAKGRGFRNFSEIDTAALEPHGRISLFTAGHQPPNCAPGNPMPADSCHFFLGMGAAE